MTYPPSRQQPDDLQGQPEVLPAPAYERYSDDLYVYSRGLRLLPPGVPLEHAHDDPNYPVRVLASPGRRLGARLIDVVILGGVLAAGIGVVAGISSLIGLNSGPDGDPGTVGVVLSILLGVGFWLYEPLFVAFKAGTPGKLLLGIRVVRKMDGSRPGFGTALGRFFFPFVLLFVPFGTVLNILWLLWDRPLYQCLHDKAASTVVVRRHGATNGRGSVAGSGEGTT